jgi:large subunit ribosomal protein L9
MKTNKKSLEIKQQQDDFKAAEIERKRQEALVLKEKLEKVRVSLVASGGKDGRMFGAVSAKQICEELQKQHKLSVDKRKFVGENSATSFGTTKLKVELFKGVIAEVTVDIKEK